ncbi:enoyl-CoA hydratase-related protein [Mucilaginibacter sp. RS28]|uniref:Enoyl-CoA hydratase-related protein n=1 Tax=Mucilaginibacter straminoryzae TaxID=2932774 RepID=A0A9X2B9D3_9SPHI|nr:enoyl-CoA hydratase-related protein [Mucilaginibacter straminoryzae]MCJ8210494.1 enoyl-CoA hydratase-related protein [Mucilaginibacter straminoryzae]
MSYQNILVENKGRIRYITINRESKLNALNKETIDELNSAFTDAFEDKTVSGVIITGAGTRAFVAGADISEFQHMGKEAGIALAKNGHERLTGLIANGTKPVIAAINGFALGGGLELALACHMRVASATAKMGLPEVTLGLIPGYGGTQRLTELVGKGRAMELILTADMVTAEQALQYGLINYSVPAEELIGKAEEILNKILQRSPKAVTAAIKAVNAATYNDGYPAEIELFGQCFETGDFREGVAAFLEKRKPLFNGE